MLATAALAFLAGCPAAVPEGTVTLPVETNREVEVSWIATRADQALWLDIELDHARGLSGPIRVTADGKELVSGSFSSGHKGIEGRGHWVHNWSSTPWGVSGQVHLWDLPEVAVGTPMRAVLHLRANAEATVLRVDLQVREPALL